jgi:hypothetical protein
MSVQGEDLYYGRPGRRATGSRVISWLEEDGIVALFTGQEHGVQAALGA